MFEVLLWLVCGMLTGWIAYLAMKGDGGSPILAYLAAGTIGSIAGGYVARDIDAGGGVIAVDGAGLLAAIMGSVLAVLFLGFLTKGDHSRKF